MTLIIISRGISDAVNRLGLTREPENEIEND